MGRAGQEFTASWPGGRIDLTGPRIRVFSGVTVPENQPGWKGELGVTGSVPRWGGARRRVSRAFAHRCDPVFPLLSPSAGGLA